MDRLAAFINPLGMQKVLESRFSTDATPEAPKTKEQMRLSDDLLRTLQRSPVRPTILNRATDDAEHFDDITPG